MYFILVGRLTQTQPRFYRTFALQTTSLPKTGKSRSYIWLALPYLCYTKNIIGGTRVQFVMQDPLASWAVILGAIGTLVIALVAFLNIWIARKSLKLMEQREKLQHPDLEIFHINSYAKQDKEQNSRIYAVNIKISNKSDTDNAAQDLSLKIYFKQNSGITSNIVIPAMKNVDQRVRDLMNIGLADIIAIPCRIKGHDVVSGWALFEISDEIISGARIENYEVTIVDTNGITSSFEILVMREMQ